ncbi:FkbM family methyltransferase [Polynucleobacter sp.]|uniref:FkbM family methyltransferase n=1 Tax=Polynucleobacter sp. TaxID=2029855 RepID=UPI003F69E2E1
MNENVDRIITTYYESKPVDFVTRSKAGYDVTVTDKIVIGEIFGENVYQIEDGMFEDTGICIDIGGNVGAFSIYAIMRGAKKAYAFEPDTQNYNILLENIKINDLKGKVVPIKKGILDREDTVKLYNGQGASFVKGNKTPTPEAQRILDTGDIPDEQIEVISLKEAYKQIEHVYCDVLKIDCEGSEYKIIEGADKDTINKARFITMEFHSTDEVTFGKMIAKLSLTHNIHIIGKYDVGGQIYAHRY